jgi:predicted CopG family antitoxin
VSESVQSLEDLKYFTSKSQYTVSESARGQLALKLAGDEESVAEAISELAYGAKQQLAKSLGIKANQSSEDLEEALTEAAEEIQLQMETQ